MSADAAADYDTLKARHIARAAELRPEHLARLTWSPGQIAEHRLAGLRKLLRHAKTHSPWHAKRLAEIDPETVDEVFQKTLRQRGFSWSEHGESLLRRRKPWYYETEPRPGVSVIGARLSELAGLR